MPTNVWKHQLFLTDVHDALCDPDADFEHWRDELIRRVRAASWCNEEKDITLRYILSEMEQAGNLARLNEDWRLLQLWADKDENRVWLETTLSEERFRHQERNRGDVWR